MRKHSLSLPMLAVAAIAALAAKSPRQELLHSLRAGPAPPAAARGRHRGDRGREARAGEAGRGRSAASPWHIPLAGWKDILARTYKDMSDHRLLSVAGGLVFFILLAIFPAIAALVSLYALFADPRTISEHLAALASFVPPDSLKLLTGEVNRISATSGGTLGIASVAAILLALWSANSGTKAVFDGLNVAYGEKEKRGFIRLNLTSLAVTVGAILLLLVAAGAVVVVPLIFAAIGLQGVLTILLSILRWPILLVLVGLALAVLYRYGPSRRRPKWRWVTPGSLAASVLWLVGSWLFSFYLSHFANYNATYGSLGALIGLLMWLWITFIAILLGAELDAEIEHQAGRDKAEGGERPLGRRGATIADTVGTAKAA